MILPRQVFPEASFSIRDVRDGLERKLFAGKTHGERGRNVRGYQERLLLIGRSSVREKRGRELAPGWFLDWNGRTFPMRALRLFLCILGSLAAASTHADVGLAPLFTDYAVLQRDRPVPV